MPALSLKQANRICNAALEHGRKAGLAPLCVAVLDQGAHIVAVQREDGASLMRPDIAIGKAAGTLAMGFGGRELARRAAEHPTFFTALISLANGRMVPVPGGVLIRNAAGEIVGAVGISGDISQSDEACAVAGIVAAGMSADTGAPS
ncbi:GlcG/HbpS family heme-binding protein [Paraburkholderia sp. GAS334]|uniref:GlcG/HbpS family heme-binding protein n=1 Tax=Paraburkholderia sp. GAS334 TaxID=3035131 RepID=UPI003D24C9FF